MFHHFYLRLLLVFGLLPGLASPALALDSFPPETLVHVRLPGADALEAHQGRTLLKPIGDIRVGDEVLAFSEWKEKGNTPNADERLSYEKVTDIFTSHREQTLVHLTLQTGEQLTATAGHPFKTPEGWRDAILLKKGGKLLLKGQEGDAEVTATIADVSTETKVQPVLNLEVANAHTFFVGEEGVLVHNGRGARGKDREKIWNTCGGKCSYCGCSLQKEAGSPNSFECDHYYPVAGGGPKGPENQVGSCRSCNRGFGASAPGRGRKPRLPGR